MTPRGDHTEKAASHRRKIHHGSIEMKHLREVKPEAEEQWQLSVARVKRKQLSCHSMLQLFNSAAKDVVLWEGLSS